jgi:hypothetical protein
VVGCFGDCGTDAGFIDDGLFVGAGGEEGGAVAALLAGYTTNKHIVDESSARTAIAEATATD